MDRLSPLAEALLEDMVAYRGGPRQLERFEALAEGQGLEHGALAVADCLDELGRAGYIENYLRWTVTAPARERVALLAKARTPLATPARGRLSSLAG